ncbi:MAG: ABC transporter permease [Gammaproteobacteria bacterium]|nr:ABC transporter permease [Gammaproteobacteria bacterium]
MLPNLWREIAIATAQTIYMVGVSTLCVVLVGLPLGTVLYSLRRLHPSPILFRVFSMVINAARSVPFIILLVALLPVTRFLIGSSIGIHAAMVPLVLGAIPFFARLVDNVYLTSADGLIETGASLGMDTVQMIRWILLPEAVVSFIQATTVTAITLVNYSAMAGVVGGGGLGDLAIRYGYQRFQPMVMVITVILLILIVQGIQMLGDGLARRYSR